MADFTVYLGMEDLSEDERESVLEWLRTTTLHHDTEFIEEGEHDDQGPRLVVTDRGDEMGALATATRIMRGACDGTDIDPGRVRLSPEPMP